MQARDPQQYDDHVRTFRFLALEAAMLAPRANFITHSEMGLLLRSEQANPLRRKTRTSRW